MRSEAPTDDEPKKDDPRFSGDYNAFRKAYKAWNARAGYVKGKKARAACQQQAEAGLHAKPKSVCRAGVNS